MSPIFTRACRSALRSWFSINSAAEDTLLSVMEFSVRPLRGGLSVFIRADIWLMSAIGTKRTCRVTMVTATLVFYFAIAATFVFLLAVRATFVSFLAWWRAARSASAVRPCPP